MYAPQRIPPDRPVAAADRVLPNPNRWLLLVGLGLGFTTWIAFLNIGIRARRRAWLAWAAVYGAILVFWVVWDGSTPENSAATNIAPAIWMISWIGGTVHAAVIKSKAAQRIRPPDNTRLEAARQRIERRAEGRRLAARDPRLARELGVGRPDLPGANAFGLVDVNHASQKALCRLPGITPELGRRITEVRGSVGSFTSVEDLGIAANLPPGLVDELRDYVILL